MKQISNKRTIADVIYDGEQITLKGQVEIDSNTGQVKSVNGDVRLKDGVTYIGNFSMLGINIKRHFICQVPDRYIGTGR